MAKKTNDLDVTEVLADAAPQKAAEAAVNQTVIQTINPGIAKAKADNERIKKLDADFKRRLAKEEKVTITPPKYYAEYLGSVYAFTLNSYNVVVRFDGTKQQFPKTVADYLLKKFGKVLDSHVSENEIKEL